MIRQRDDRRPGVAAVEFALMLPLIMLLLVGVWEVGRMVEVQQIVSNAAREGARQAATGEKTYSQIKTVVLNQLKAGGVDDTTGVKVGVKNVTTGDTGTAEGDDPANYNPTAASQLHYLEITVEVPFENVKWAFIESWVYESGAGPTAITGSARWTSMKDVPLSVDDTIPQKPL